jgi:hypothetical protein
MYGVTTLMKIEPSSTATTPYQNAHGSSDVVTQTIFSEDDPLLMSYSELL